MIYLYIYIRIHYEYLVYVYIFLDNITLYHTSSKQCNLMSVCRSSLVSLNVQKGALDKD